MTQLFDPLTARQRQVAQLILQGVTSNRAIAERLRLKPRTVKGYFWTLYRKFGIDEGNRRVKLAVLLLSLRTEN